MYLSSKSRLLVVPGLVGSAALLAGCMTVASAGGGTPAEPASAVASASASASVSVSIPADWPEAIPLYEGGTLDNVSVTPDSGDASAVWITDEPYDAAVKAYSDLLIAAGFTLDLDTSGEGFAGGEYSGNGYAVSVSAFDAGGTQLAVTASNTQASAQ